VHRGDSRPGHVSILRVRESHLAGEGTRRHARGVNEEEGIYRSEVREIIGALADIKFAVFRILGYIEGEIDEEEEDEENGPPDA
jgi:hypothetical protein